MDFQGALSLANEHARKYVAYLVGFFSPHDRNLAEELGLDEGAMLIYALVSCLIGIALQDVFISRMDIRHDYLLRVVTQLGYWVGLALLLHLLLSAGPNQATFMTSSRVVFTVFPPVFVGGAYFAFLFYYAAILLSSREAAPYWAGYANAAAQFVLVVLYLPRALLKTEGASGLRKLFACGGMIVFLAGLYGVVLLGGESPEAEAQDERTRITVEPGGPNT